MPELDPFDIRLASAVHTFADRAQTRVDAVAVAQGAMGRHRNGAFALLGRAVPVPVSLLILLALILASMAWSLQGGAPWDRFLSVGPGPMLTPEPTLDAVTPAASPDGQGDEHVRGTETLIVLTEPGQQQVGSVVQMRGGVAVVTAVMNDPRLTGTGTWRYSSDTNAAVATEWGTYHLENERGAWDGTCSGGSWSAGHGAVRSCWLTGSGEFAGFSYFLIVTQTTLGSGVVEGVIYPGSPLEP